ncbi:MAG: FHA domain-containing protein, partial [Syntrophobacteria bacterium]
MATWDRRRSVRIKRHFLTQILNASSSQATKGVTENLSQLGAFIKTNDWRAFKVNDQAVVTFFLPHASTAESHNIGLRGDAVICRVDPDQGGIAIKFNTSFHQFERLRFPEVAGKARYKRISYYLSVRDSLPASEFVETYRKGFLVEKSRRALDPRAIFQFSTGSVDEDYVMRSSKQEASKQEILQARVIEIQKRKLDTAAHTITIGRSPVNDIVLYNNMVSKSHAYLYVHPSGQPCYVMDSGSKNGTLVNNRALKPYEKYKITDRDEICFGSQVRVVYFCSATFSEFLGELKAFYWQPSEFTADFRLQ